MAQGLSSLLGGLAQGFTDLGKSTLDVLGGGTTNNVLTAGLDALINKKSYGQAVKDANQRQKDFRKWLYETDSDKDAAAKGLGTALNGAQTAIDLIPGLGQSAPVNAIQGAIGGLADEFKFNGENYDWGKGAQRAAVGAGAGLAAGGLGKALANSGSKVLSNGVLKGAATGSLGGALSQAGGTAIEGGNADQILQSAAQGAQFGALLGAGTGGVQSLAGALKKTRAKNSAPAIMDEEVVMAELAPEGRNWDELYEQLSDEAGVFENENRTPITATPEQLRNRMAEIDAKYGNDLPDEVWNERFALREQQRALENGYSSPYDYYVGESKKRFMQDFEANPRKYKQKMDAIEKQKQAQAALEEDIKNASPRKLAQFQLIQQKNPAPNDTLTWIRSPKEILTWDEAITGHRNGTDEAFSWPDYSFEDALRDQKRNRMTVYSSYPVKGGTFVTPSYQQASDYAGGGRVYSKVIRPNDVAWINGDEGQYAYTRVKADQANDVMAERVAPGQLGLFDQTQTTTPKTATAQLGLFDQPTQPVTPKTIDVADVNPYAPVNGQVTQAMLDRASETLKNYKKGTPDNELYNRIDPETLPSGYKELRELLNNSGDFMKQRIGAEDIKKASPEKVAAYLYPEGTTDYNRTIRDLEFAKDSKTKFGKEIFKDIENRVKDRIAKDVRGQLGEQAELSPEIRRNLSLYGLGNISFRDGYTAAADNAISERLGIAPGNTLKYNGPKDTGRGVLGRYKTKSRNIATAKSGDQEEALSNVAHERLHSFQNEAGKFATADTRKGSGYDKEVINAYNELSDSLKDSKLGWAQMREIGQKLGRRDADLPYYTDANEQEARMLQQYLHDKGYTNAIETALGEKMGQPKEFNTDYYPAFDKFFDKLRELSKKGVALPAILAALGLGEYATENQEEDKDNGQQI